MKVHPGARASRPHALPFRFAQFPCDGAPRHPHAGKGAMVLLRLCRYWSRRWMVGRSRQRLGAGCEVPQKRVFSEPVIAESIGYFGEPRDRASNHRVGTDIRLNPGEYP